MFDVICANPTTFLKTSENQRRDLAREFYQRNIRDAKTVNAAYPTNPPHFMNSQWTTSNSWPTLPKSEFNGSSSMLLKQFIRGNRWFGFLLFFVISVSYQRKVTIPNLLVVLFFLRFLYDFTSAFCCYSILCRFQTIYFKKNDISVLQLTTLGLSIWSPWLIQLSSI